jgi:hypothetical protein
MRARLEAALDREAREATRAFLHSSLGGIIALAVVIVVWTFLP